MKHRTLALLLTAALVLSLTGTALASVGVPSEAGVSAARPETPEEPEAAEPPAPEEGTPGEETAGEETPGEAPEELPEYIPDPVGSVSFTNLNRRMHEGNLQVLAIQESIDMIDEIDYDKLYEQLRNQLNDLAKAQWSLVMASDFMSDYEYHSAYDQMDQAYAAIREQFEAIKEGDMQEDNEVTKRQLRNLQNQIVKAGEATYIALAAMELQEDGLERQLAALDRQLTELELRYELGHISSQTLKQARAGRTALASGLDTLRMNLSAYKGQLELLIGADITGNLRLKALPAVSREDLAGMDLEKDLETAKANSWDVYEATETMKDELDVYNGHQGDAGANMPGVANTDSYKRARHNWLSAKYTYDNTVQNFALSLRNLYLKVKDCKQILDAAKTALAVEQDNCAAARLKQSQGTISQNALLEAEDKLKEAEEKVSGAENDLFSAYNTYHWAVDYGIIN